MSDFPEVNIKELRKNKKQNLKERLIFIDQYVEWLKKTSNSIWSKQLKALD